ncbi:hypothetical protein [Botrimarina hoheduenensis]|uniref:hypothetical protein n=1 Tax=Botrimarina hoheduenensis TaxID=2528000 RepID=UPI0011B46CB7|nr:hypothetical protein [Botrimarina hoheduenensis]
MTLGPGPAAARRPDGVLTLEVVDSVTSEPLPVRIELRDARGRTVRSRDWGQAGLGDHAYLEGRTELGLRRGAYRFLVDPGPEYRTQAGHFEIDRYADDSERIEARRFANLAEEGWVAFDPQCQRAPADRAIALRAERLSDASCLTHWGGPEGWQAVDDRLGDKSRSNDTAPIVAWWHGPEGTCWLYAVDQALTADDLPNLSQQVATRLAAARQSGWRIVATLDSSDLLLWAAVEALDAVWLLDGTASADNQAGQDRLRTYYDLLNAGVPLPPLAGSGSGIAPLTNKKKAARIERPLGDQRTWTRGAPADDLADFWTAVELGQVVVSNGPLLRPTAEGLQPGGSFETAPDRPLEVLIGLNLATRETVDYLEVVADGEMVMTVRLAEWSAAGGKLPPLEISKHRWFAIRAITTAEDRLQLAHSGPWYVERAAPGRGQLSEPLREQLQEAARRASGNDPAAFRAAQVRWPEALTDSAAGAQAND